MASEHDEGRNGGAADPQDTTGAKAGTKAADKTGDKTDGIAAATLPLGPEDRRRDRRRRGGRAAERRERPRGQLDLGPSARQDPLLGATACGGGHVRVNGERVKPAYSLRVGDECACGTRAGNA